MEPRASHMLGKTFSTEPRPHPMKHNLWSSWVSFCNGILYSEQSLYAFNNCSTNSKYLVCVKTYYSCPLVCLF
jgi:hypothetical protein